MTKHLELLLNRLCLATGWAEIAPKEDLHCAAIAIQELTIQRPRGPLAKLICSSGGSNSRQLLGAACKELRTSKKAVNRDYAARLANAIASKVYADSTHTMEVNIATRNDSITHRLCAAYSFASVAMRRCAEVSPEPGSSLTFTLYHNALQYATVAIDLDEHVKGNRLGSAHPLHYIAGARAATILSSYHGMRYRRVSLLGQAYLWWKRAISQDNGKLPNQEDFFVAADCASQFASLARNRSGSHRVFEDYCNWRKRAETRPLLASGAGIQKV